MRKPKRPKRPKITASPAVWERYESRMKEWEKKCKEIDTALKRKEAIIKKYR